MKAETDWHQRKQQKLQEDLNKEQDRVHVWWMKEMLNKNEQEMSKLKKTVEEQSNKQKELDEPKTILQDQL